uniref:Uncharacterized protein n=1 Tax=Rhabditophanes sp. KR3021 TaxID=114890 RepID=A0AC35UI66_9BILA
MDTADEAFAKAVQVKKQLDQLKANERDKSCCVYLWILLPFMMVGNWKINKMLLNKRKKYQSKEIAENVEAILINSLRSQLTNSSSGKVSLDLVLNMNPQVNSQVAQLILKDFSECGYEEYIMKY